MTEPRRSSAELSEDLDELTQALHRRFEADGALGVVVIVALPQDALVGCASDCRLAEVWPTILHRIAGTIRAQSRRAIRQSGKG